MKTALVNGIKPIYVLRVPYFEAPTTTRLGTRTFGAYLVSVLPGQNPKRGSPEGVSSTNGGFWSSM